MRRGAALFAAAIAAVSGALPIATVASASVTAPAQTSAPSSMVDVGVTEFAFAPAMLQVSLGSTVRWSNHGQVPHVVTDRGGTFDTQPILPGKFRTVTFTVPGTYSYFCRVHPGRMNAMLVVGGSTEQARVNRIEATEYSFTPSTITVATGSLLLLANVGALPHTLTADGDAFDTGVVTPGPAGARFAGSNISITLTTPGTFPYVCRVHPTQMRGVITVTGPQKEVSMMGVSAPRTASVSAEDFQFAPVETTIAPGGEITWRNTGAAPHTATFDDVKLNTDIIKPGGSEKLIAPTRPGTYSYRCAVHPTKMRAVLVVLGANMSDPTKPVGGRVARASAVGGGGLVLSSFALATGAAGAFLGGFGISGFARRRARKAPKKSS